MLECYGIKGGGESIVGGCSNVWFVVDFELIIILLCRFVFIGEYWWCSMRWCINVGVIVMW